MDSLLEVTTYLNCLAQQGQAQTIAELLNLAPNVTVQIAKSDLFAYYSDGAAPYRAALEANGFQMGLESFLGFHAPALPDGKAYEQQLIRRVGLYADRGVIERRADDMIPDAYAVLAAERLNKEEQMAARAAIVATIRDGMAPMQPNEKESIQKGIATLLGCSLSQGRGEELIVRNIGEGLLPAVTATLRFFGVPHVVVEYNNTSAAAFLQLRTGPYTPAPDGMVEGVLARVAREKQEREGPQQQMGLGKNQGRVSRLFRSLFERFSSRGPS